MQVTSTYRYARISAFKAREVTRAIQGQSASDALDLLTFSPKKAALLVKKTLKSAIANAENNASLKVDTLLVKEAVVGEGPTYKRFRARARGSASPLRKRTSHIRIILSDDLGADGQKKPAQDVDEVAGVESAAEATDAPKAKTSSRKSPAGRGKGKGAPKHQVKKKSAEKAGAKSEKKDSAEKKAEKSPTKKKD
jgi:large subunit ribosomal protein L22